MSSFSLECVIHYENLENVDLSSVTPLSEATFHTIKCSASARKELGGENLHLAQIKQIPEELNPQLHGYHRKCYQKFTKATSLKRKNDTSQETNKNVARAKRSSRESGITFEQKCMICHSSNPLTVKGKKQFIKPVQTFLACSTIEKAAILRKDEEMLRIISGEDLIAKEFHIHQKCYKDYTLIVRKKSSDEQPKHLDEEPIFPESKFRFDKVCEFIQQHVLKGKQCVSMKLLADMYGFDSEDKRLRLKLKQRLQSEFGDELLFLSPTYHEAQVIISKTSLQETRLTEFNRQNKNFILKEAASLLRSEILSFIENAPPLPWPPTAETLTSKDRTPPTILSDFLTRLIHSTKHTPGKEVTRLVDSFGQDIVHAISKGSFLTAKHTLLSCGLHSMTGQKMPIQILSKLGHCCNYDKLREIETAQAELVQQMRNKDHPLALSPKGSDRVLTYFWWDNFDCVKETISGSVHTCHGIAYQQQSNASMETLEQMQVQNSKRRAIQYVDNELPKVTIAPKKEPPKLETAIDVSYSSNANERILTLWETLRRISNEERKQSIPRFVGWVLLMFGKKESDRTVLTFLPPIRNPITEYSTVLECIVRSQGLAEKSKMKYVHITVDAGAAEKFFHVIWNYPDKFHNVIVHLGDFHAIVEFFGVIGKLITGSGFEDIVYEANMCTSGGIKGVLSGKHYNRSWTVHECFAEALNRLFIERFKDEMPLPFPTNLSIDVEDTNTLSVTEHTVFRRYENKISELTNRCLQGEFGKTPQYWMQYKKAVDRQHLLHFAININDWELRKSCWKNSLPLCFSMNKQNYARYGSFYVNMLENIDETHPGAREEIEKEGLAVKRNSYNIGQSIDAAGEQTFMKCSKTTGGIKNFVTQNNTYEKWVLNRSQEAKFVQALRDYAEVDSTTQNPRKCLREKEIEKSENKVKKLVNIMNNNFINPFSSELDKEKLYNLASGQPLSEEAAQCLLSAEDRGKVRNMEFFQRCKKDGSQENFFDPVKRVPWHSFLNNKKKTRVNFGVKYKDIEAQRDILGLLLAKSSQDKAIVNIDKALSYPLCPVPLALASSDGQRRKTCKSKLFEVALSETVAKDTSARDIKASNLCYFVDLAATVRSTIPIPDTFKELALKILNDIPAYYQSIYVACDTYRADSLKNSERILRGQSEKFVIKNADIRIPADFKKFLDNGDNKERLFELIEKVWIEKKDLAANRVIYFCRDTSCTKIKCDGVNVEPALITNHEEADTKFAYMILHAQGNNMQEDTAYVVRSPSADIDIPVILLGSEISVNNVYIDSGTGKHRKLIQLSLSCLTDMQKQALIGLHAFTGNDIVSSFFRKGKPVCWNAIKNNRSFLRAFGQIGSSTEISENLMKELEKFVCYIYGQKKEASVNAARASIFWKKLKATNKVIDISLLPPCQSSLEKHAKRANYVAMIWRQASFPLINEECPTDHGWLPDYQVAWIDEAYPPDVQELLVEVPDNDFPLSSDVGNDSENDSSSDEEYADE